MEINFFIVHPPYLQSLFYAAKTQFCIAAIFNLSQAYVESQDSDTHFVYVHKIQGICPEEFCRHFGYFPHSHRKVSVNTKAARETQADSLLG